MPTVDLTADLKRWCVWVVERAFERAKADGSSRNPEIGRAIKTIRQALVGEADESELADIRFRMGQITLAKNNTDADVSLAVALKGLSCIESLDDMLDAAQFARDTVLEADPEVDRELARVLREFADDLEKEATMCSSSKTKGPESPPRITG